MLYPQHDNAPCLTSRTPPHPLSTISDYLDPLMNALLVCTVVEARWLNNTLTLQFAMYANKAMFINNSLIRFVFQFAT